MTDRIAGTLLMGLDAAIEFATLGEFRIVEGPAPRPYDHAGYGALTPAPLVRRPHRATSVTPDLSLLPKPSTALARTAQPRPTPNVKKAAVTSAPRRRGGAPPMAGASRRKRGGDVPAGTQLCLFTR